MPLRHSVYLIVLLIGSSAFAKPWQRHTIDNSSRGADGVRTADVNRDGWIDMVTGWEQGGVVRVYINPGPARARYAWPAVTVGRVQSPEDAVFVDLDGDAAVDVVSCCEGKDRTVYVHWAPRDSHRYLDASAWTTDAIPCTQKKQAWMFALPMQMDGRLGNDLVVGSKNSGASIGWLRSPNNPRDLAAWTFQPLYQAGWIMSLQAHDLDGDGDSDVLASDRKGPSRGLLWLENPGSQTGETSTNWNVHRIGPGDREFMFLCRADLDMDASPDILCAVRGRGISWSSRADGKTEWRTEEIAMPSGCGTGKGVAVGDMNLDSKLDIVFSCENAKSTLSGVRWLSLSQDNKWIDHEISGPTGVKFDRIELIDLDDDGDLDVVTCEERDNLGVIWYENPAR